MRYKLLVLGLILLLGCSYVGTIKEAVAPKPTAYTLMIKPWHRYAVLKSDLTDMLASVDAVFLDCSLRKALVQYKKEAGVMSETEAEYVLEREESYCKAYYEFLVALYTKRNVWNNLDSEKPFFKVYLDVRGVRRPPERVKRVDLKDDEVETFYPFVKPWMKVYRVRFGRAGLEDAKSLKLVLASLQGRMELTWSLR